MVNWVCIEDEIPSYGEIVKTRDCMGRVFRTQMFGIRFKIVGYVWEHSNAIEWTRDDVEVSGYDS